MLGLVHGLPSASGEEGLQGIWLGESVSWKQCLLRS
jgi:hypothetical protein